MNWELQKDDGSRVCAMDGRERNWQREDLGEKYRTYLYTAGMFALNGKLKAAVLHT